MRNTQRYTLADFVSTVVPQHDVRAMYPMVEGGLREVAYNTKDDWIPADVYAALLTGAATLSVGYVADQIVSFCVSRDASNPATSSTRTMLVWVTWVHPDWRGKHIMKAFVEWFEGVARDAGFGAIETQTSSKTTAKKVESAGYELTLYTLKKVL